MQQCLNPANWGIQGRNGNEKRSKKWFLFVYLFFCILNIQKPAETLSAILAWTNSLTHSPSCSLSPPLSLKEAAFCDLQIEADHVTSGRFVNQERGGSWGWNCLKGKAAHFKSLSFVKCCYLILSAYTHWMWKWQQHKGNRWTKYKNLYWFIEICSVAKRLLKILELGLLDAVILWTFGQAQAGKLLFKRGLKQPFTQTRDFSF